MYKYILCIILFVILYEIIHLFYRINKRYRYFELAKKRAKDLNVPLVIIGDPYNGTSSYFVDKNYFHEVDICMDLSGCPNLPDQIIKYKGDLVKTLPELYSYIRKNRIPNVVFYISYTLEYVDSKNIDVVLEWIRVLSGNSYKNIYNLSCDYWTLVAYLYRSKNYKTHSVFLEYPPNYRSFKYKKITI